MNYYTGLSTKNKIMDVCRKLFYEDGFNETTFSAICQAAHVLPGSLGYHYKSKKNIASGIYSEIMHVMEQRVEELFPDQDELLQVILSFGFHQKLLFTDPQYRRFSAQCSSSCIHARPLSDYEDYVPKAYSLAVKYAGKEKVDFLFTAFKGIDCYIEPYIDAHINDLSFEKVFRYTIELYYRFIDDHTLNQYIEKALEYLMFVDISCIDLEVLIKRIDN
ncbi:MAG TPA: TetR/AcrR family transcriptional regulator [Syntrophomonas sp.]|nr:TetR/AcrR family transcriptional regulator [Syntrophomonas sp.]